MGERDSESNVGKATAANTVEDHDAFAEFRAPKFRSPAPGSAGSWVESSTTNERKCRTLLDEMSLLGNSPLTENGGHPEMALTALSRMTQADVNKCAETAGSSYKVEKDAKGDVSYLGYRRPSPDFASPEMFVRHPLGAAIFGGFGVGVVKVLEAARHAVGDDSWVRFKEGQALLKVPGTRDILDGYNRAKVKLSDQK